MLSKLCSWEFLIAYLAHDLDSWAVVSDMVHQIFAGHVLELFEVTDVAAELAALELGVVLELVESLPDYFRVTVGVIASMRELTEVDAVSEDEVEVLEEVTLSIAIGAARIKVRIFFNLLRVAILILAKSLTGLVFQLSILRPLLNL